MALKRKYDDRFEKQIWPEYPKWPVGRSNKEEAEKAFLSAEKKCGGFTEQDVDDIVDNIRDRTKTCATWQKGSYGAPAARKYFNQMMWNEPFSRIADKTNFEKRYYDVEQPAEQYIPANPEIALAALRKAREALH